MSGATIAAGRLALMLTELRLPTIKRLAEPMCEQCDREGWPARRLLEALFEHEMTERQTRRIDRHRAESGLGPDKRLSSFDFASVPSVSKAQVMALAEGHEWLDRGANVLLFGPPGVGKSHLVSALGHALIDAGRRVLFTRCGDLVQRLQAARRDLRLPQELAKLDRFDLLILDDLSYVRRDQAETSALFELIAERYRAPQSGRHGEHAVLAMRRGVRRAGDDAGRGRPARAPRDDPGDERPELPPASGRRPTAGAQGPRGGVANALRPTLRRARSRPPWTSHPPTGRGLWTALRVRGLTTAPRRSPPA